VDRGQQHTIIEHEVCQLPMFVGRGKNHVIAQIARWPDRLACHSARWALLSPKIPVMPSWAKLRHWILQTTSSCALAVMASEPLHRRRAGLSLLVVVRGHRMGRSSVFGHRAHIALGRSACHTMIYEHRSPPLAPNVPSISRAFGGTRVGWIVGNLPCIARQSVHT
jgi:hypothetical protein